MVFLWKWVEEIMISKAAKSLGNGTFKGSALKKISFEGDARLMSKAQLEMT